MAWMQSDGKIRPKVHMFLELSAEPGPPSSSWNYREESFGGYCESPRLIDEVGSQHPSR